MKKVLFTIILLLTSYSPSHAANSRLSISFDEKKSFLNLKNDTQLTIFYDKSLFSGRPPRDGYPELVIRVNGKKHEKYCAYADSFQMPRKLSLKPGNWARILIDLQDFEAFHCIGKGQKYQISFVVKRKKISNPIV